MRTRIGAPVTMVTGLLCTATILGLAPSLTVAAGQEQRGSAVSGQQASAATADRQPESDEQPPEASRDGTVRPHERGRESELEFVRIKKEGKVPVALQTAIVTYRREDGTGPEVTLIGAIHVGEREYYQRLNELFQQFDALLFEMVMDPQGGIPDPEERGVSPVSTIQVGLKEALGLSFQLDEIDYHAANFVHADMTPEEFFETMRKRKEGVLQMFLRSVGASLAMQSAGQANDLDLITALMAQDSQAALRRAFAEQMSLMDGQMAALTGEDGKSTLITERNAKAMEVLQREIAAGKKKLGIFYGAGHLEDMHRRLVDEFGLRPVDTQWLDAWSLR
ncbi:MAG: hypothetical protein KatS3mg111_1401 [Pirellulaceae bacterium]|nr:MAG: hypothetical protein KatS3mg111_1401 [Pirellulaceae bacterium]